MLYKRYIAAVEAGDVDEAAEAAREYRNKLLEETDCMMVSDRPLANAQAWVDFRQALRDIPESEGFPLAIVWPERPE